MEPDLSKSILSAIASSYALMSKGLDVKEVMPPVLQLLGEAARVDRVYVFENYKDLDQNEFFSQKFEWVAPGIEPQIDNPMLQQISWTGLESLREMLIQNKPYSAIVSQIEITSLRIALESQDILAVLFLPIFVKDDFWGWMGFDNCTNASTFTEEQVSALFAFSSSIGNQIAMQQSAKDIETTNNRLGLILDSTQSGFWDITVGPPPVFYFSDSVFRILGFDSQNTKVDLHAFEQLLLPRYHYILEVFQLYSTEPKPRDFNETFAMYNALGEVVWFEARGKVFEVNNQFKFVGVLHDVTREQQAIHTLADTQLFIQNILETITETLFSLNTEYEFVFLSPAWSSLTGMQPSDSIGKPVLNWVVPSFQPVLIQLWDELQQNPGEKGEVEIQIRNKSEQTMWVRLNATYVQSEDGQGAFRGVIVKTDEKKKADLELEKSRQKLENIIHSVDDILYTFNPQEQSFTFVSSALEKKGIGVARDTQGSIPAKEWERVIEPQDLNVWTQAHSQLESNGWFEATYRVRPKNNAPVIWLHDSARRVYSKEQNTWLIHGLLSDVTEMQKIKDRLQKSEKQFKSIALKLPAPLMIVDSQVKKVFFANEKVLEQVDIKAQEPDFEYFMSQNKPLLRFLIKVSEDLNSGKVYNKELELNIQGKTVWYRVSANGIHISQGASIAVVFNNINPIKVAEKQLYKTNQILGAINKVNVDLNESKPFELAMDKLLRALILSAQGSMGVMAEVQQQHAESPTLKVHAQVSQLENDAARTVFDCDESALANEINEIIASYPAGNYAFYQLKKQAIVNISQYCATFNNASEIILIPSLRGKEMLGVVLLGYTDKNTFDYERVDDVMPLVNGYAGFIHAHHINREKDSTQQLYNLISSNTLDVIAVHNPDLTFTYVSPSIEKMVGYSPAEIVGKKPSEIFGIPDPEEQLMEEKKMVIPHTHKQGGVVDVEVLMKPIFDSDGKLKSYLAAARDVTEREHMLKDLESALEAQKELGALKSKFVSMVSHEFRTPVATILSSAELLQMSLLNIQGINADHVNKHLNRIKHEVKRITNLLNDVLILEKHAQGKQTVSPQKVLLIDILEVQLKEVFGFREDASRLKIDPVPPQLFINTDPQILQHIVINLVENALKYSDPPLPVKVSLKYDNQWIKIYVTDQGIGIPKKEQAFLFESFFRASNASKISGTGLGLSIVKQFVSLLKGTLHFKSEHNQGTEFVVTLPKEFK